MTSSSLKKIIHGLLKAIRIDLQPGSIHIDSKKNSYLSFSGSSIQACKLKLVACSRIIRRLIFASAIIKLWLHFKSSLLVERIYADALLLSYDSFDIDAT